MRRNLNYIYKLLMSYPRLTAGGLIFLFVINFFDMAYWENYGIMNALFGAITYVLLALILKIVWFTSSRHRELSGDKELINLEPTPVLFVVITVLVLVIIMSFFAIPSLYNIHNIQQLEGL